MAVKQSSSGIRMLTVLEAVADHQPIGLAELAEILRFDKSAVQRSLTTLAAAGWIRHAQRTPRHWELTTRTLSVAHRGERRSGLRHRARATLERLRDETGESIILAVRDDRLVVALDVAESRQLVRTAPTIGIELPLNGAGGLAVLAHLPADELPRLLGDSPDATLLETLHATRVRGWALNHGDIVPQASAVGSAIFDTDGRPVGAVVVSGPTERMPSDQLPRLGLLAQDAARNLSAPP